MYICSHVMVSPCILWLQTGRAASGKAPVSQRLEVVDDFVRNFLVRMGMTRTLDSFQTEWCVITA